MSNRIDIPHTDETKIKDLLLGRRIVSVEEEKGDGILLLDNGTRIRVVPNSGDGYGGGGDYWIANLGAVDNAITDVVSTRDYDRTVDDERSTTYSIFVFTDGVAVQQEILKVVGGDGNGYYGSGFRLDITLA